MGRLGDIRAQPLQDLRGASRTGSRLTSRLPTPETATTEEAESPVSIGISHRKLGLIAVCSVVDLHRIDVQNAYAAVPRKRS